MITRAQFLISSRPPEGLLLGALLLAAAAALAPLVKVCFPNSAVRIFRRRRISATAACSIDVVKSSQRSLVRFQMGVSALRAALLLISAGYMINSFHDCVVVPPDALNMKAIVAQYIHLFTPPPYKYKHSQVGNRLLVCLVLGGGLLAALQPPLPLRGGAHCPRLPLALCPRLWDERHVPLHDSEDAEVGDEGVDFIMWKSDALHSVKLRTRARVNTCV